MFNNAEYPFEWSLGYIVPIFKGGDPSNKSNYRGITLNSILAKIYSQIFLNMLNLNKFDQIMSPKNKIQVNMLAKFIYDAFSLRLQLADSS